MEGENRKKKRIELSASFKVGAVALAFLIIGYQVALFVKRASESRIVANRDHPDTVFVYQATPSASGEETLPAPTAGKGRVPAAPRTGGYREERRTARHSPEAEKIYRQASPRRFESFRFDPNTASVDELMRLGLSEKQAMSIESYRQKGGKFRRASDFARSYVVSDTLFARLEPFIDIPLLDINVADSAAFDALPGIGPYFAAKMAEYRDRLHGYSYPEQLMDIWKFDSLKFDGLRDLVTVGPSEEYPLWTLPEDSLKMHPYIRSYAAHGIVLFRENTPPSEWSVEALSRAGILSDEDASRLLRCRIKAPGSGNHSPARLSQ